jgi:hypothetical protein
MDGSSFDAFVTELSMKRIEECHTMRRDGGIADRPRRNPITIARIRALNLATAHSVGEGLCFLPVIFKTAANKRPIMD